MVVKNAEKQKGNERKRNVNIRKVKNANHFIEEKIKEEKQDALKGEEKYIIIHH